MQNNVSFSKSKAFKRACYHLSNILDENGLFISRGLNLVLGNYVFKRQKKFNNFLMSG